MDLRPVRKLSVCTGGAGLDLGVGLALPRVVPICYVEIEAYPIGGLVARMEEGALGSAPLWTDVRTFDGLPWRGTVDLLVGGYPCQPFSIAGKQRGADDPRHLWPSIARIIDECRPRICFLENVGHHLRLGYFTIVKPDLERLGYRVEEALFTAEEIGAPHQRDRLFIMAHRESPGGLGQSDGESRELADADRRRREQRIRPDGESGPDAKSGAGRDELADAERPQLQRRRGSDDSASATGAPSGASQQRQRRRGAAGGSGAELANAGHTERQGRSLPPAGGRGKSRRKPPRDQPPPRGGSLADAGGGGGAVIGGREEPEGRASGDASRSGSDVEADRERLQGDGEGGPAPGPTGRSSRAAFPTLPEHIFPPGPGEADTWTALLRERPELAPALSRFDVAQIALRDRGLPLMGPPRTNKGMGRAYAALVRETLAESGVRGVAHGLAAFLDHARALRVDALHLTGNGVVPLQAAYAFAILARRFGWDVTEEWDEP